MLMLAGKPGGAEFAYLHSRRLPHELPERSQTATRVLRSYIHKPAPAIRFESGTKSGVGGFWNPSTMTLVISGAA